MSAEFQSLLPHRPLVSSKNVDSSLIFNYKSTRRRGEGIYLLVRNDKTSLLVS